MEKNVGKVKKKKHNKKIRKFSWKLLIGFVFFEFIFSAITGPFVLLHGPFENAKSMFVGTAMKSMHYQWLATTFLSKEQIDKIMGTSEGNGTSDVSTGDSSLINVPKNHDNSMPKYYQLDKNPNFIGHVIEVSDPSRVKIGYTSQLKAEKKVGEPTSKIAETNGAVAAVNGGAFTDEANSAQWSANGGIPSGVIFTGGEAIFDDTRGEPRGTIAIDKKGVLFAGTYTTKQLKERNTNEAVSFATDILVSDGKKTTGSLAPGSNPRTIIGQRQDGTIVLVALDSRRENRVAATLKEAQDVMISLKCVTAATLDGGKSTTMYYEDEVVNTPSYELGERYIPTAVIVK